LPRSISRCDRETPSRDLTREGVTRPRQAGKDIGVDRAEVEAKLATVAARRQETLERLEQQQERLARVEDERAAIEGDLILARRAVSDFENYEARLQEQLAAVEIEEARVAVEQAVATRNRAAEQAAAAAEGLRSAHDQLQRAREAVSEALSRLRELDRSARGSPPPEPVSFEEQWQQLAPLVEQELNVQLQAAAVAAAARSANHLDIERLPDYLQPLARERRRELLESRRKPTG
jgi:exonuclease SbcC